jgi:glutathione synthase/RimK-type ligase-like ATP-grasp enzyme
LIEGIVESFKGVVLTKPSIMRKANNKILQISLANEAGFYMPESAITNEVDLLKHFSSQNGILKPIAIGEITRLERKEFVQTNLINSSFEHANFEYSPVYLQKFVEKDFEVRVTIVGRNVFPVKIKSDNIVDWRKPNNKVVYDVCSIPQDIQQKCFTFMESCDMNFGCFDFIVKDGTWYFLEMNANGQWVWLEFETGVNISGAVIDYLASDSTIRSYCGARK